MFTTTSSRTLGGDFYKETIDTMATATATYPRPLRAVFGDDEYAVFYTPEALEAFITVRINVHLYALSIHADVVEVKRVIDQLVRDVCVDHGEVAGRVEVALRGLDELVLTYAARLGER